MKVKTLEDAAAFVKKTKICTVFPSEKTEHTSLYEHVDLPEKQPGESGWGQRVEAVWPWKNQLPAQYPDAIYYGKIKGGFAVLMAMDYLAEIHFPSAYCSKSQFDTALKNLQISMNVVRDCEAEQDTWLTFQEVHAEIWNKHVLADDQSVERG
jgi:hypothetical protein